MYSSLRRLNTQARVWKRRNASGQARYLYTLGRYLSTAWVYRLHRSHSTMMTLLATLREHRGVECSLSLHTVAVMQQLLLYSYLRQTSNMFQKGENFVEKIILWIRESIIMGKAFQNKFTSNPSWKGQLLSKAPNQMNHFWKHPF